MIPLATWNRCIQRIDANKSKFRPWAIAYSVLFGIGGTAGLSIAPLMASSPPSWAVPIYSAICVATLVAGIAFVFVERSLSKQQLSQFDQLIGEMEQLRDESLDDSGAA